MPSYFLVLLAVSALAACDTATPELPVADPVVGRGTFTAPLNGEPWSAPVEYSVDTVQPDLFYLRIRRRDSTMHSGTYYEEYILFRYRGTGFAEGQILPLSELDASTVTGRSPHVFLNEQYGDAVAQTFEPVEGLPGELRIVEVDSSANRLRATFEATLVGIAPRNRYQQLPDTLHFTEGAIVTGLFPAVN